MLGFSNRVLKNCEAHYSDKTADITKIDIISLDCDVVNGSYINSSAHTLHQFSLNVSPSYKTTEAPDNVIYLPLNTINTLVLKIVYKDGNLTTFRGEKISVRLHLKPAQ